MSETIPLGDYFQLLLREMPEPALKIFLFLTMRVASQNEATLTLDELANALRLHRDVANDGITWLSDPTNGPILKVGTKNGKPALRFDPVWANGSKRAIPFAKDVDPSKRTTELEEEIRRLGQELDRARANQSSDLTTVLKGEDREVCFEVEQFYGRPLTQGESYYLGQLIALYQPARVRTTFRSACGGRGDPLRATYAILKNGGKGKPYVPKGDGLRTVRYREVT